MKLTTANKRDSGRIDHSKKGSYRFANNDKNWKEFDILNISSRGIGVFCSDSSFYEGDKLILRFSIMGKPIDCNGRVMHVNGRRFGIHFFDLTPQQRDVLKDFIESIS